jgi:nucleoside triphosphatase
MDEKPRLCVGALVFNNDELLLLKSPKWERRYVVPCGHVEFMEPIEDAVRREVREETGLEVDNLQFLKFLEFINPRRYHKKNLHFVGMQYACQSRGRNVQINKESTESLWTSPQRALDLDLEWGTKRILEHYLQNYS